MTTTGSRPIPPSAARPERGRRQASDFAELAAQVRAYGLLERRRGSYVRRAGLLAGAVLALIALAWLVGDSWWQLVVAGLSGIVLSQFGFLAHDGAHRQIFARPTPNEWAARLLSTIVIGLSYGWWTHKHSRHHRSPNQVGRDPDIAAGGLVFTTQDAGRRPTWLRPLTRRQGYLFFPLLLLEGVNLHAAGLRTLARRRDIPHRVLEAALIVTRFTLLPLALLSLMSVAEAVAFIAVQVAVFGFFLGAAFAPNHKGMPLLGPNATLDFLRRQVLMSRNIRSSRLVDLAMGGLNYQIEHHLFPSMPRANLRRAQPLVRAFCRARDIPYTETTLAASYGIVVRHLNDVGLAARDPFTCPFAQAHRT